METTINKVPDKLTELNEEHAFRDLYRHYFVRLYRFCYSIVHQKEPAEEIVHDVFLKLWKRKATISEIKNLEVYLYISVKNHSLNYLRNDHFHHLVDIESLCNDNIQFQADPEALLVSAETIKKVLSAVDQLPPKCKLIFKLIKEDGLKYKDVAALLDLSVKTVEAQLAIAIKKIAQAMGRS
jgi:RNA polymerase sigma-70 factor (ECF subfamily)